jgi:hypothetical protein
MGVDFDWVAPHVVAQPFRLHFNEVLNHLSSLKPRSWQCERLAGSTRWVVRYWIIANDLSRAIQPNLHSRVL